MNADFVQRQLPNFIYGNSQSLQVAFSFLHRLGKDSNYSGVFLVLKKRLVKWRTVAAEMTSAGDREHQRLLTLLPINVER